VIIGVKQLAVAGAATAIGAAGILSGWPSAHAFPTVPLAPACQDWKRNGALVINTVSQRIEISWDRFTARGPALLFYKDTATTPLLRGSVSGGISGAHLDFTIDWENPGEFHVTGPSHFLGDVDPQWGRARGVAKYYDGKSAGDWVTNEWFDCATPAPAPAPPPKPAAPRTATVTGDVDVYNIAWGDVPDEETGVVGVKIGMLRAGQKVEIGDPCKPNDWCKVLTPELPGGLGFVWGHLSF
jgi:hypothetical protein